MLRYSYVKIKYVAEVTHMITFVFQEPFNKVTYAIIGDDSAPSYFRINENSGAIQVSNNLENDATRTYSVSSLQL